jgi:hypothetical protein
LLFREQILDLLETLNNIIVGCKDEIPETKAVATCPKVVSDQYDCKKVDKTTCEKTWATIDAELTAAGLANDPPVAGLTCFSESGKVKDNCQESCNNCGGLFG